jgi:hypothetical protein
LNTRKEIPYLQATMYYFVYYINILLTTFSTIFRRFPTTFRRFSKSCPKATRTFPNIFRKIPKVTEDSLRKIYSFLSIPNCISVCTKVTRYANASEAKKPSIMRKYIILYFFMHHKGDNRILPSISSCVISN